MRSAAGQRHDLLGLFEQELAGLGRKHAHVGMLAGQDAAANIACAAAQVGLLGATKGKRQAQGRASFANAVGPVEKHGVRETA